MVGFLSQFWLYFSEISLQGLPGSIFGGSIVWEPDKGLLPGGQIFHVPQKKFVNLAVFHIDDGDMSITKTL